MAMAACADVGVLVLAGVLLGAGFWAVLGVAVFMASSLGWVISARGVPAK